MGAQAQIGQILPPTLENLSQVAFAIQQGEVVGMPTETVYGLAGNAFSPLALARIFETKERPTFDPLILHVDFFARSVSALDRLQLIDSTQLSKLQRQQVELLIQNFWPGPLTLVLPKHPSVPDLATSGLPTVALRMPKHPVAQALITAAKCPLAAPSANRFGRISPTTAQAVIDELGDRIRFILDGGTCEIGLESTIVGFDPDHGIEVLRPGGTSVESLEHALGTPLIRKTRSSSEVRPEIRSPGMLESHYAPKKQLILLPKKVSELNQNDVQTLMDSQHVSPQSSVGLILMSGHPVESATHFNQLSGHPVHCRTLSLSGDLKEAAHSLFGEMRYLDASDAELIFAEPCNSQLGIGYAISDRLKRASARRT